MMVSPSNLACFPPNTHISNCTYTNTNINNNNNNNNKATTTITTTTTMPTTMMYHVEFPMLFSKDTKIAF